jgi:DNA-binding MarR family transcriptional regulator
MHVYTCIMDRENTKTGLRRALPMLPCACANLRRAARTVSRMYNEELRSDQIEITQFTLLMALQQAGEISQGKLGKLLGLDSTTLTRMLELLRKRGWIQEKEGEDRRFRIIRLTTTGGAKLQQSLPHWKRAQERMQSAVGEGTMSELGGVLARVITALSGEM